MLSNMMLFILSIIADEPINPYAIIKVINHKRESIKYLVHAQTVYSIINILKKRKLISGKKIKCGRRPDKTIYAITKKGEAQLRKCLTDFTRNPEDQLTEVGLFLMTLRHLDNEAALALLKEYQKKIAREVDAATKRFDEEKKAGLPDVSVIAIEHIVKSSKVNLHTVEAMIDYIENNPDCKSTPVPFWRNEVS